jgi:hypothetical protein
MELDLLDCKQSCRNLVLTESGLHAGAFREEAKLTITKSYMI